MSEVSLSTLIASATKAAILQKLLDFCAALGLETESWQNGDPTLSELDATARYLEIWERIIPAAIAGGFLDLATGDWLTLLARYRFNVERRAATFATCTVTVANAGGALFELDPDDLTIRNEETEATFRNDDAITLVGGASGPYIFTAEVAGSESNSSVGEIVELVTVYPKITVANTTAAIGTDEESDAELRERCRAKLQALSPNGAKGAYQYVATTPEFNGGAAVTRTRDIGDSDTGKVVQFMAGPAGAVSNADRDAVIEAVEDNANPLVCDYTGKSATNLTVDVTYTLWVYDSISKTTAEVEDVIETALEAAFVATPIAGDIIPPALTGYLYQERIRAAIIQAVAPHAFKLTLADPAADVPLALVTTPSSEAAEVAVLGSVTATINFIEAP